MVADLYGATRLPLDGSTPDGKDPLLSTVASFFQAIANVHAKAEWEVIAKVGSPLPCLHAFTHDPHETNFIDNNLPALFLWRSDVLEHVDEAQDIRVIRSRLRLLWVPPNTGKPDEKTRRTHFPFKLVKLWDDYLELGRDPAWLAPGDPDPEAPLYGSVLARFALFRRLRFTTVRAEPLMIELLAADGAPRMPPRVYTAQLAELALEEELRRDPARFAALHAIKVAGSLVRGPDDPEPPLPIVPLGGPPDPPPP